MEKIIPNNKDFQDFSMQELISHILNLLALAERKLYLEAQSNDKANGFFKRNLSSGPLTFKLKVPRTRNGGFRPSFLPKKWQRHSGEDYASLAYSLLLSCKSIEAAKRSLRELNLPVSEEYLEEVAGDIREHLDMLNSSPIDPDLFALILDVKVVKLKVSSSIVPHSVYTAVGISLEGHKRVLAVCVSEERESATGWRKFLKSLLERGLRRVLIVVHDDFPGLSSLVETLFPKADDQICVVHMLRNLKHKLPPKLYKQFKERFQTIRNAHNYELGSVLFDEACEAISEVEPEVAKRLLDKKEKYLAFLKYPPEVRSSISSTNVVEALNRKMEDVEQMSGGYFHSVDDLKLKMGILVRELHLGRWRKPYYKVASVSHILRAEFERRFENEVLEQQTQFS